MIKDFILQFAWPYKAMQYLSGAGRWRSVFVNEYVKPAPGWRILDICCGTAEVLPVLGPEINYVGIDYNQHYIKSAQKNFEATYPRAQFICSDVTTYEVEESARFDRIIMMGAMHHLSDDEVIGILKRVKSLLKVGGRFCSVDGVFLEDQSALSRFILKNDRGTHIREAGVWVDLVKASIPEAKFEIRRNIILTEQIIFF